MQQLNTNYYEKIKKHNIKNREFYSYDEWVITQTKLARKRLNKAIRKDGTIIWSNLPNLLATNPKLEKSNNGKEWLTSGQSFAPSYSSGYNTCPFATDCAISCLMFAGHGQKHMMSNDNHFVFQARLIRTWIYMEHFDQWEKRIIKEITALEKKASKLRVQCAVRLNVISDIMWEKKAPFLFSMFPNITFYDYTAIPNRNVDHIPNYYLVYSRKENNEAIVFNQTKYNVSCVFKVKKNKPLPKFYKGLRVVDADKHDRIWEWAELYPNEQLVLGLRVKGKEAWKDTSGFAITIH